MRIFLNSCGYSRQDPSHEYRWKCLTNDPAIDAVEELNRKRFSGLALSDLIESDSRMPCMVLARDKADVILLITRIPSLTRLGSQGDTIYSSLLIVGKEPPSTSPATACSQSVGFNSAQPNDFAGIGTAEMPPNLIQGVLDAHVRFQDSSAFVFNEEVDFASEIEEACDDHYSALPVQQSGFTWRPCIGHNCFKLRARTGL